MPSCAHCSLVFNFVEELRDHTKQLHSSKISLNFPSEPKTTIILKRDPASNCFTCPGCDKQYEKYQQIYNHSKRVAASDVCHATKLLEYLCKAAREDEGKHGSDGSLAGRTEEAAGSLMIDSTKRRHAVSLDSANCDDVDMDAFLSPHEDTASATPKHTPNSAKDFLDLSDFDNVDMDAFLSPYKATPPTTPKLNQFKPMPGDSSSSMPRHTAAEKGKQRAISSRTPSPTPPSSISFSRLPLPTLPIGALMTEVPSYASKAPGFLSRPLPYGSKDVVTSVLLNTLNCVLYVPFKILICVVCSIAVQPRSLRRHRKGTAHNDEGHIPESLVLQLIDSLQVRDGDTLYDLPLPFTVVPGIPFREDGLKCPLPGCSHCCQSRKTMGLHIKNTHSLSIKDQNPTLCAIQAIFDSNKSYYPVTLPQPGPTANIPLNLDKMIETQYRQILSEIDSSASQDEAHLTPFLAKYKWHEVVADLQPSSINEWTSVPRDDETALTGLKEGVLRYYKEVIEEMGVGESWTTVLRFVNSAKL
jgi:Orsellinic acid/F9775 biosynthesis cluster protein D